jgi:hypothetical protein
MKKTLDLESNNRFYYVTNQFNLREILSSGFIASRHSFDDKYYEDLLNLCPGKIPLFENCIDEIIIKEVNRHDPETSYAVIFDIEGAAIDRAQLEKVENNTQNARISAFLYEGALYLNSIKNILFLNDKELRDFSSRTFKDLPDYSNLFKVDDSFVNNEISFESILKSIGKMQVSDIPSTVDFIRIDKMGGAGALYCSYVKNSESAILDLLRGSKSKKLSRIPAWIQTGFEPKSSNELASITDINQLLYSATVTVLHRYNFETVNQRTKILDEIEDVTKQAFLSEEDQATLQRRYARTKKYINNEIEFEPFRSQEGDEVLKSILLFLLRPQYSDLLLWKTSETGASTDIMATALTFAGIVAGRKSIDVKYRPIKFEEKIVNAVLESLKWQRETKVKVTKGSSKKSAGKKESEKEINLFTEDKTQYGTTDGDKEILSFLEQFKVNEFDLKTANLALDICKQLNWDDCLYTHIESDTSSGVVILPGKSPSRISIRIMGPSQIKTGADPEMFRTRLSSLHVGVIRKLMKDL